MNHATELALTVLLVVTLAGCANVQSPARPLPVEFRIGESQPATGLTEQTLPGSERPIYLHDQAVLTNTHIASAKVKDSPHGSQIEVVFTEQGRQVFAKLTRENIEKRVAIIVDGEVVSAPVIKTAITGGMAVIAGRFTRAEANRIAEGIMRK